MKVTLSLGIAPVGSASMPSLIRSAMVIFFVVLALMSEIGKTSGILSRTRCHCGQVCNPKICHDERLELLVLSLVGLF